MSEQSQANDVQNSVDEAALPLPGRALEPSQIAQVIEAALLAAESPLTVDNLFRLFTVGELDEDEGRKQVRSAIESLQADCAQRGVVLQKVASGYRYQTPRTSAPGSADWGKKARRGTPARC